MVKAPTCPFSTVIRDVQIALNHIKRTRYKGGVFADTYALVNELERHLALDNVPDRNRLLEQARNLFENDDCEIDDDARLAPSECGMWVQAWVWVRSQDL